jgi:hypothetical protein
MPWCRTSGVAITNWRLRSQWAGGCGRVRRAGPGGLIQDRGRRFNLPRVGATQQSPIRHTDAPVELTVDADDDMVRIEVRDDDASLPGSGRVVSFELREASTDV